MDIQQIKFIHEHLVRFFADSDDPVSPPGIKNENLLESAVNRPFMSAGGQDAYIGIFNKAAALFHSIINNHCFHNGNKRTGLLSTLVYLGENGWWVTVPTDNEMFEFTRQTASHELCEDRSEELFIIGSWFQKNSRRRETGEFLLKFHELRDILTGFGYELSSVNGRTVDIFKDGKFKTSILQKGSKGKEDYDKQYIQRLRKKLKLTPDYGVDSYAFYGDKGFGNTLNRFMKMRHKVMRELAKI